MRHLILLKVQITRKSRLKKLGSGTKNIVNLFRNYKLFKFGFSILSHIRAFQHLLCLNKLCILYLESNQSPRAF